MKSTRSPEPLSRPLSCPQSPALSRRARDPDYIDADRARAMVEAGWRPAQHTCKVTPPRGPLAVRIGRIAPCFCFPAGIISLPFCHAARGLRHGLSRRPASGRLILPPQAVFPSAPRLPSELSFVLFARPGLLSHHVDTKRARRALRQHVSSQACQISPTGDATTAGRKHFLALSLRAQPAVIEVSEPSRAAWRQHPSSVSMHITDIAH